MSETTPKHPKLIDVVYRVRPGDQNEELRYSLRSLVNVPHARVWLVGHKPTWVTGVEHIQGNHHPHKWPNVYDNTRLACRDERITDPFLLIDDDMFLMEPTTVAKLPKWHRGPLTEHAKSVEGRGLWAESLRNTLEYLQATGIDNPISYELHIPYLVHKQQMLTVLDEAAEWSWPNPPQWRTLDGNLNRRRTKPSPDVKIRRNSAQIPQNTLLSSDDNSFHRILPTLRRAFPHPCQYEQDTEKNPALEFYRQALRRRGTPTQRARATLEN